MHSYQNFGMFAQPLLGTTVSSSAVSRKHSVHISVPKGPSDTQETVQWHASTTQLARSVRCTGRVFFCRKRLQNLSRGRGFRACANRRMPWHFKLRAAFAPLMHYSPYAKESSTKLPTSSSRLAGGLPVALRAVVAICLTTLVVSFR